MENGGGSSLMSTWHAALAAAGITDVTVEYDDTDSGAPFADGEARFRWGMLVLRLVRDRGQHFVDLVTPEPTPGYLSLDDVGIAEGWRVLEDVNAREAPIPLADDLREIAQRREDLEAVLAPQRWLPAKVKFEAARQQRERALVEKLERSSKRR